LPGKGIPQGASREWGESRRLSRDKNNEEGEARTAQGKGGGKRKKEYDLRLVRNVLGVLPCRVIRSEAY